MEHLELHPRHLIYMQTSIDSFLPKNHQKLRNQLRKKLMEQTIPQDCRCRTCVLSPSIRRKPGARHHQLSQQLSTKKTLRCLRTQRHASKPVWILSSLCSQRISVSTQ